MCIRDRSWIANGGVLIRFAGPRLAEASQDNSIPLMPIKVRGGGRAFGGALTWDIPQELTTFKPNSPFGNIDAPNGIFVRRQLLAEPGGDTSRRSWAQLADGTPLVSGQRIGTGAIVLFHTTATPEWSDLPISKTFIDMLKALAQLSALGPEQFDAGASTTYPPINLLNGYGEFARPSERNNALTAAQIAMAPSPARWPGHYGDPATPLALNAVRADVAYGALQTPGRQTFSYDPRPPQNFAPILFSIAFLLFLIDAFVSLALLGKLRLPMRASNSLAIICTATLGLVLASAVPVQAQPIDAPIADSASNAILETRLAYVRSGDKALDTLSQQALTGLSRELYRRTALEPADPVGIDPETDDLSIYPFLYWPVSINTPPLTDAALANIENFMRFGGLILFDTRDAEARVTNPSTPQARRLQQILRGLDIPPLAQIGPSHVLLRSFYLLDDLYGRYEGETVWAQTGASADANDGVTPIVIGGRDWASAWAINQFGQPVRPMARTGERGREYAYRAGVNIVMVAFTGNYKSDQVHTPILLERLAR